MKLTTLKKTTIQFFYSWNENGFTRIAMQTFTKEIKKHLGCDRKDVRLNGKKAIIFIK